MNHPTCHVYVTRTLYSTGGFCLSSESSTGGFCLSSESSTGGFCLSSESYKRKTYFATHSATAGLKIWTLELVFSFPQRKMSRQRVHPCAIDTCTQLFCTHS